MKEDHDILIRVDENVKILLQRWERTENRLVIIESQVGENKLCQGNLMERTKRDEIEIDKLRAQTIVHNWINSIGVLTVGVLSAIFKF